MTSTDEAAIVLGFPDYAPAARRLADAAGLAYAEVAIHAFPDGESLVRLPEKLPRRVIFCRSLDAPNSKLIELELAAAAARDLGAAELTLVAPYLCYMRQDRAFHPGEAVSQRIVGRMLARRFETLVTVDPHLHRTHQLADAVPVRHAIALNATAVMAEWLAARGESPLLIGPDEESEQWVAAIAQPAGLDYGVARKRRLGDRKVEVELPEIDFRRRSVVLVDDIASTGETLAAAARAINGREAESIAVLVTHALFVGNAIERLERAGVREILSTDSIEHPSNALGLAGLLATAIEEDRRH